MSFIKSVVYFSAMRWTLLAVMWNAFIGSHIFAPIDVSIFSIRSMWRWVLVYVVITLSALIEIESKQLFCSRYLCSVYCRLHQRSWQKGPDQLETDCLDYALLLRLMIIEALFFSVNSFLGIVRIPLIFIIWDILQLSSVQYNWFVRVLDWELSNTLFAFLIIFYW